MIPTAPHFTPDAVVERVVAAAQVMTAGGYIRLRRDAAGLSIADVDAVLAGSALLSAPLAEIEAGRAIPTGMDAALLSYAFALDDLVVAALKDGEDVLVCGGCGCSERDPCDDPDFGTCDLLKPGVCSVCRWQRMAA